MTLEAGTKIADKYTVERVLGEGGMGVVYLARHAELGVLVAIKVLRDQVMSDPEAVLRFSREAKAAALLDNEHIARVLDVGKLEDGRGFMVMEYLPGRDLGQELDLRRQLPVGEAIDYVVQACDAMQVAHARGIVHRDLKPANLFLVRVGRRTIVKLVDFGISRFAGPNDVSVTQTQTAFGTPLYMAPEALRSAKYTDARSDVWALGVILYELIAGIPPFLGDTPTAVGVAITVDKQKPLTDIRPDVPPELDAVIAWALEKSPDKRPQTAEELAAALRPILESRASLGPRSSRLSLPEAVGGGDGPTRRYAGSEVGVRTGMTTSRDVREKSSRGKLAIVLAAAASALVATVVVALVVSSSEVRGPAAEPPPTATVDSAAATAPPRGPDVAPPSTTAAAAPAGAASAAPESAAPPETSAAPIASARSPKPVTTSSRPRTGPSTSTGKPRPGETAPKNPGGNPLLL